jgi:ATP-binding cassette subfamily B protein/subfamily B ATP-binding cassette protein MsbA
VDGKDVREIRLKSLRSQIALMPQDPLLLDLSVAGNIAYGRPDATLSEIMLAAKAANADEFIRSLPEGYDSMIGERGASLSGGQRQRVAIARAILKDSPILLLDESTSALDAETESGIMGALERLQAGRTTIIIAHRLSTIRNADRIVVLDSGRIVATGAHQDLMARCGLYRHMHSLQFHGALRDTSL